MELSFVRGEGNPPFGMEEDGMGWSKEEDAYTLPPMKRRKGEGENPLSETCRI